MARSFGLVDDKLFEADFFLDRLLSTRDFLAARYFFSAFVAAARSVTFAMQASLSDLPGFAEWYASQQTTLRNDAIAQFFHRTRTDSQHLGVNPLGGGTWGNGQTQFFFLGVATPEQDVHTAARRYMQMIVNLVRECYIVFGPAIDPDQYYTITNLCGRGLTVEDVEEELGFPRGWTSIADATPEDRLRMLRREVPMTGIGELFVKYPGT